MRHSEIFPNFYPETQLRAEDTKSLQKFIENWWPLQDNIFKTWLWNGFEFQREGSNPPPKSHVQNRGPTRLREPKIQPLSPLGSSHWAVLLLGPSGTLSPLDFCVVLFLDFFFLMSFNLTLFYFWDTVFVWCRTSFYPHFQGLVSEAAFPHYHMLGYLSPRDCRRGSSAMS